MYNSYNGSEKEKYYYDLRKQFDGEKDQGNKSILFYFLMKTGFNGIYRKNKNDKFNVPFERKDNCK